METLIKAIVIQEDKATLHLGFESDEGTTFQAINNPHFISLINKASQALPGVPCEIMLSIEPAQ